MAWPATELTDHACSAHLCGEAIEQLPIKRLMSQLIGNAPDVFVGNRVVAGLRVHKEKVAHR